MRRKIYVYMYIREIRVCLCVSRGIEESVFSECSSSLYSIKYVSVNIYMNVQSNTTQSRSSASQHNGTELKIIEVYRACDIFGIDWLFFTRLSLLCSDWACGVYGLRVALSFLYSVWQYLFSELGAKSLTV